MSRQCARETDLLDALQAGYVTTELSHHLEECADCRDLEAIAGALLDDRATTLSEARIPSSGTMWWRMQIRLRGDAETRTRRALVFGQGITLLVAVGLIVTLLGDWLLPEITAIFSGISLTTPIVTLSVLAVLALIAVPVAGWIVVHRD
ncbi:MAG: hypothetical protein KY459_15005 [Acidobacteria bacterium]|nr:hypothetical protein [Acidobacteriota bacterium]